MPDEERILDTLHELLHAIRTGDTETYQRLAADDLTCFEPETQGHPVDGLPFHLFFMEHAQSQRPFHLEVVRPTVRVVGDLAYAAYSLIITTATEAKPEISSVNETRIFQRSQDEWKMVHFHRS